MSKEGAVEQRAGPGAEPGAPLLSVRDLEVAYGGVQALHGVSLDVREGEIVAVLGNNGAGKSTLLRSISATLGLQHGRIQSGSIELRSTQLVGLEPAKIVHL